RHGCHGCHGRGGDVEHAVVHDAAPRGRARVHHGGGGVRDLRARAREERGAGNSDVLPAPQALRRRERARLPPLRQDRVPEGPRGGEDAGVRGPSPRQPVPPEVHDGARAGAPHPRRPPHAPPQRGCGQRDGVRHAEQPREHAAEGDAGAARAVAGGDGAHAGDHRLRRAGGHGRRRGVPGSQPERDGVPRDAGRRERTHRLVRDAGLQRARVPDGAGGRGGVGGKRRRQRGVPVRHGRLLALRGARREPVPAADADHRAPCGRGALPVRGPRGAARGVRRRVRRGGRAGERHAHERARAVLPRAGGGGAGAGAGGALHAGELRAERGDHGARGGHDPAAARSGDHAGGRAGGGRDGDGGAGVRRAGARGGGAAAHRGAGAGGGGARGGERRARALPADGAGRGDAAIRAAEGGAARRHGQTAGERRGVQPLRGRGVRPCLPGEQDPGGQSVPLPEHAAEGDAGAARAVAGGDGAHAGDHRLRRAGGHGRRRGVPGSQPERDGVPRDAGRRERTHRLVRDAGLQRARVPDGAGGRGGVGGKRRRQRGVPVRHGRLLALRGARREPVPAADADHRAPCGRGALPVRGPRGAARGVRRRVRRGGRAGERHAHERARAVLPRAGGGGAGAGAGGALHAGELRAERGDHGARGGHDPAAARSGDHAGGRAGGGRDGDGGAGVRRAGARGGGAAAHRGAGAGGGGARGGERRARALPADGAGRGDAAIRAAEGGAARRHGQTFSRFVGAACGPAYLESKIQADSLCRCRRTSTQCECHCGEFGISKVY
ncbi:hypothetical protein AV274_4079, partial [Blastocystis sp. ATCC 50177/Nand II]